jgi:hypothetical protein
MVLTLFFNTLNHRLQHRTEEAYAFWVRRYILLHDHGILWKWAKARCVNS